MNVVFRPSTKSGHSLGSLSLRLIHRRKVKVLTLPGCRLYSSEWNRGEQTVVYPENVPERVAYLEEVELKVKREQALIGDYICMLEKQGRYTVDDVVCLYREKRDESKLLGYTALLANELERREQTRTARAYRTVTRGLVHLNGGEDIPLEQINHRLIRDFERYLKENGKLPNTVSYYMRNLRAIYNKAVQFKRITPTREQNPFSGVYTGVTKTVKRALKLEDVHQLRALDFSRPLGRNESASEWVRRENLSHAWRYFFFCLHARGMSFVDMAYLKKKNIRGNMLKYCRKKTGTQIEMRITTELRSIIDSFSAETADSPYLFPIIRDKSKKPRLWYENALRVQNNRLKVLAKLAGIAKPISTHVARHTWATIGKQRNVPLRVLSDCLGHSSENTTQIYLGMLDNLELERANEVVTSAILGTAFDNRVAFRV